MQSLLAKLCALGACVCLNACGSSGANFYDAPSGSSAASGGANASNGGSNDSSGSAGSASNGVSGSGSSANGSQAGSSGMNDPNASCSPARDVSGGTSGELGTMGPACLRVMGAIAGWGCSNFDGRTLKVNGQTVMCGELPLPGEIDGAYYFDISAGTFDYASFYWY